MTASKELLDELMKDCKTPEDLLGKSGVLKQLTKGLNRPGFAGDSII